MITSVFNRIANHPLWLLATRVVVGGVFVVFGVAKALAPLEEFAAAINEYAMLPEFLHMPFAVIMIILEIAFGAMLLLGVYTRVAAKGVLLLLVMFIIAIGQAMIRGLDLPSCGCGGGLKLGESPSEVLWRDTAMAVLLIIFVSRPAQAVKRWTVDSWLTADTENDADSDADTLEKEIE